MNNSLLESLRFQVHVRNLLYDYVQKHCTVDYLTFTEGLVSEFFEDLQLVPLTDPYSLTLPVDPLDTLQNIYSESPSYSPEDDVLQISQEAVAYLKEAVQPSAKKSKTSRVVMSDSYGPPTPLEPFYSTLTRRARMSTKKLGTRKVSQPCTLKEMFEEHELAVIEVEIIQEPSVDLEDTLKIKIAINSEDQQGVKSLLQSTLDTLRPEKPYMNRHLDSTFLCSHFPEEPGYTAPKDVFVPLFPRRRQLAISTPTTREFTDFKGLLENVSASFEPVNVIDLDEDIPRQNMVLVDGWQAIKSSPPSTPSSKTGSNAEIDELDDDIQFPSSPCTTPPLFQELENSKMEPMLIPRSRRVGGKAGITPHILRGKTLKTFLGPLLFQPRTGREEGIGAERDPSPAPSSLIGQPPSALDIDLDIETESNNHLDLDVGLEIQKICEGYQLEPDFVLYNAIDEKAPLLMDVPILPQPNEFPKNFYVPESMSDLVIPSAARSGQHHTDVDFPIYRFLKKVKGCQSLGLALSWVPFTTDEKLPTVFEILDVVDIFPQEATNSIQARGMIDSVNAGSSSETLTDVSTRRGLEAEPEDLVYEAPAEEFHIMLNRKKRNPLNKPRGLTSVCERNGFAGGHSDPDVDPLAELQRCLVMSDVQHMDDGDDGEPFDHSADIGRPSKKPRLLLQDEQQLLHNGCPLEFTVCRTQESEPAAAHCVPSEKGNMIWPCSTSDSDTNYLVRSPIVHDFSFIPPSACLEEPSVCTQPSDSHRQALLDTGDSVAASHPPSSNVLAGFDPSDEPELAKSSLGSFAFAQLRARKVSMPQAEAGPVVDPVTSPRFAKRIDLPRGPPPEICDANTINLAEAAMPQSVHKYMACLELIQKRALVCALCSRNCAIELVERQDLAGPDLILDTDTAVFFFNLFALPARCNADVEKIAKGSWKFDKLLIVFEAYGELSSKRAKHQCPSNSIATLDFSSRPYAYTPPIVKALGKFKRGLSIAEAWGKKRSLTVVQYAFADTVEEAALFTRLYGDLCEANDRSYGALWGDREWLGADILEEEEAHLASLNGINHFSASIILCQVSLEEFIDLLPEERVSAFGAYILPDRIRECNEDLDARLVAMQTEQVDA